MDIITVYGDQKWKHLIFQQAFFYSWLSTSMIMFYHRTLMNGVFLGPQGNSGWKRPQKICTVPSCSKQGQLWDQTSLFRALSTHSWRISKVGDLTTSLSNLFQHRPILKMNKFFLITTLNLLYSHHEPLRCIFFYNLPTVTRRLLLGPPEALVILSWILLDRSKDKN